MLFHANDHLQSTLNTLMQSGSSSNPALNKLLDDYTNYHRVVVVVGGLFLMASVGLSVIFWKRFKGMRKTGGRWAFERKTYFCFGVLSVVVGVLLAVTLAANLSNALRSRSGFSGTIGMLGVHRVGSQRGNLHEAFSTWLESGQAELPFLVKRHIRDRLAWQRPKAGICTVLLILFAVVSARVLRTLVRNSRRPSAMWKPKEVMLNITGFASIVGCLLLVLMVLGNTAASVAPLTLTLVFG